MKIASALTIAAVTALMATPASAVTTTWSVNPSNIVPDTVANALIADGQGRILPKQPRSLDPSVKGWIMVIETRI